MAGSSTSSRPLFPELTSTKPDERRVSIKKSEFAFISTILAAVYHPFQKQSSWFTEDVYEAAYFYPRLFKANVERYR